MTKHEYVLAFIDGQHMRNLISTVGTWYEESVIEAQGGFDEQNDSPLHSEEAIDPYEVQHASDWYVGTPIPPIIYAPCEITDFVATDTKDGIVTVTFSDPGMCPATPATPGPFIDFNATDALNGIVTCTWTAP